MVNLLSLNLYDSLLTCNVSVLGDVHHKVLHHDNIRLVYSSLYCNFGPLQFDYALTSKFSMSLYKL